MRGPRVLSSLSAALSIGLLLCSSALGGLVAEHIGSADPVTEGWVHRTNPGDGGSVGPVAGAWEIVAANPGIHYYQQPVPSSSFTDGWKLTATVDVISSPYYSSTVSGGVSFQVDNGGGATGYNWMVCLIDDTDSTHPGGVYYVDRSSGTSTVTLLYEMDTASFHTYNMVYDPLTNPDAVSVWVDSIECGTILNTHAIGANLEGPYTNWGDAAIWSDGISDWSYVSFETLTGSPIPAPSAFLLCAIGLGAISRKRQTRKTV